MHLGRVSAYKQHDSATAPPQTPLCERPAEFVESLGQVLDWKALQSERISAIGGRFEQEDGGPGKDELLVRLLGGAHILQRNQTADDGLNMRMMVQMCSTTAAHVKHTACMQTRALNGLALSCVHSKTAVTLL